jgi:hypothetical protein
MIQFIKIKQYPTTVKMRPDTTRGSWILKMNILLKNTVQHYKTERLYQRSINVEFSHQHDSRALT